MNVSKFLAGAAALFSLQVSTLFADALDGGRFLTINAYVRVWQIEVSRDKHLGADERAKTTPEKAKYFRETIAEKFPNAKITWCFSWFALWDDSQKYKDLRAYAAGCVKKYGDDFTFLPGGYFPNAYNTREQVNRDLRDAIARIGEIVGGGFRPKSVVAGFLSSENMRYLAEEENIHVCQGNVFSQYAIDNQDGDGSPAYPYFPSKEHFCKPAQGASDFVDCVNLDGWTVDFLAARREGFKEGFNSRLGIGPIETLMKYGTIVGVQEMLHTHATHFDAGLKLNGFAWNTVCWEIDLPLAGLSEWLEGVRKRWPDTRIITQGEFGELWRAKFKDNNFDYRFVQTGSGIGGSDIDKTLYWYMTRDFRLALLRENKIGAKLYVIDFTDYTKPAKEPSEMTRKWSLLGYINQKRIRPQDEPKLLSELPPDIAARIAARYPELSGEMKK